MLTVHCYRHPEPYSVARLLGSLREAGAREQATALAERAAAHVPLDDPGAVADLLGSLREAGAREQVLPRLQHRDMSQPGLTDTTKKVSSPRGAR